MDTGRLSCNQNLMKKLIALFTALTLLTPAFAIAQQGPGPNTGPGLRGSVEAHLNASSTSAGPGKLGPAIKNLASTTRAEWKGMASTTRMAVRAKVEAIHALIEKHKDEMHERAEAARTKAHEHFGQKIEQFVGNISDRLASTSQKLSALIDRTDTRIDELMDQGFDMSSSTTLLNQAQTDLAAANVKITAVNTALALAMSEGTTTAKVAIPAVRSAVKAAEDALKLVKDDLQKTLQSVKVESAATSTSTI